MILSPFKRRNQRRKSAHDANTRLDALRFNVERSTTSRGQEIASVIRSAREKLNQANMAIKTLENVADPWDTSTDAVTKVLSPLHDVAKIVNAFADANPGAKVLASAFTAIVALELTRRENDLRIAVVFYEMSLCLLVLADIDEVYFGPNPPATEWTNGFTLSLTNIVKTIGKFASFCELYYETGVFVKFCKASIYKDKITNYLSQFDRHKKDLQFAITAHASAKTAVIDVKMDSLAVDVDEIKTLLQKKSASDLSLAEYLDSRGGLDDVLKSEEKLQELSAKIGETLSIQIQDTLQENLDEKLSAPMMDKKWKLWSQHTATLLETSVTNVLSSQLQEGPHELIQDPDVRGVWKKMQAGTSVETKMFLNALKEHFYLDAVTYSAQHGEKSPNHWALLFLSKMILYPAVGDALDEDLSGFISLDEVNSFLISRPSELNCNALQWIAFWGFGPYKTNIEFVQEIGEMLDEIQHIRVRAENAHRLRYFQGITQRLRMLTVHTDIVDYLGETDIVNSTYDGFEKVRMAWAKLELDRISFNLDLISYNLPGAEAIALVLGNRRLEHYITFLIYALLQRHLQIVKLARKELIAIQEFMDMRASWECLFNVFDNRLNLLLKIWRQNRLDLNSHVETYAGGLFENWYHFRSAMSDSLTLSDDGVREEVGDTPNYREKHRRRLATLGIGHHPPTDIVYARRRSIIEEPIDISVLNYGPLAHPDGADSILVIEKEIVWERIADAERKEKAEMKKKMDVMQNMLDTIMSHLGINKGDVSENQDCSFPYPSRSETLRPSAFRANTGSVSGNTGVGSSILSDLEAISQSPEPSRPPSPISLDTRSNRPVRQSITSSKPGPQATVLQQKRQSTRFSEDLTAALQEKAEQPSKRDTLLPLSPPMTRETSETKVPQVQGSEKQATLATPPQPPPLPPRHRKTISVSTNQSGEVGSNRPSIIVASPTEIRPYSYSVPNTPYPPQPTFAPPPGPPPPHVPAPYMPPPSSMPPPSHMPSPSHIGPPHAYAPSYNPAYAAPPSPSTPWVPFGRPPPMNGRTPSNTLLPQTPNVSRPSSPGRRVTYPNVQPPAGYATPTSGNDDPRISQPGTPIRPGQPGFFGWGQG